MIGDRLRMTLEQRQMSVREFQRQMVGRVGKGSSYPTVHRYLAGKSEPSMAWLKSAAGLLGISEIWLAQGHGSPSPTETLEPATLGLAEMAVLKEAHRILGDILFTRGDNYDG